MNDRPTPSSVTDVDCECKYLQRAAGNPDVPIVFDAGANEYHFVYPDSCGDGTSAILNIYHCPFCGGAAPRSTRGRRFHVVSEAEQDRLADLLKPLKSVREILATFGMPDEDNPTGMRELHDETDDAPSRVVPCRVPTYHSLSDVANVHVHERPDGTMGWSLTGKYRGDSTP